MAEFWSATKTLPKGVWIVKGKLDLHRETTGGHYNAIFPGAKYQKVAEKFYWGVIAGEAKHSHSEYNQML